MTSRSYVLRLLAVGYDSITGAGNLVTAAIIARTVGTEELPVFFSVIGILVIFAALLGDRLAQAFERFWDAHWDEHHVSWAVREAEQLLHAEPHRPSS